MTGMPQKVKILSTMMRSVNNEKEDVLSISMPGMAA